MLWGGVLFSSEIHKEAGREGFGVFSGGHIGNFVVVIVTSGGGGVKVGVRGGIGLPFEPHG